MIHRSNALRFRSLRRTCCALATVGALTLPAACERDQSDASKSTPSAPQNVLLITLDTTRADRIGCYGHTKAQTPTLDALAAEGVLFERAIAQVPMTLPAHTTIMTGLYPREHGVRVNGHNSVPAEVTTLAERFQERDYRTAAFVAAFVLHSAFGLNQGFDLFDDDIERTGDDQHNLAAERPGNIITDRALQWLSAESGKPFFCWVHYYDPHDPYDPPPPYNYTVGDPYDGEIAFVDAQIKRLMDWLDESGLRDSTLILAVGDHGEAFGEHQENGHVMFLYETNVHIPFIVNHPRVARPGHRVDTVVELTDIAPTIADLFDLPPFPGKGRSLRATLSGAPLEPRPAYAESDYPHYSYGWAQQRSITTQRWKYVSSTKPELFDLQTDPGEFNNRIDAEPETAQRLADALHQLYNEMTPASAAAVTLDDEARKKLESLGYAASGSEATVDELLTPGLSDPKEVYHVVKDLNRAKALTTERKWDEALPLLQKGAQHSPGAFNISEQLARCYEELGRVDDAIETWRNTINTNPTHINSIINLSELLLQTRRYDDAIEHLEAALAIDDRNTRVHGMLANAYHLTGQLEKADQHARRAIELSPTYTPAVIERAAILADQGNVDEAIKQLESIAAMEASYVQANFNTAQLLLKADRQDEAIERFEKVCARAPAHLESVAQLTRIYREKGRIADMARVLHNALELQPDNLRFVFSLAQILATARDDSVRDGKKAIQLAQRATDLVIGDNPEVIALLAAAYAENGDWQNAEQTAARALDLAKQKGATSLAGRIETQLSGYRSQKPYRDPGL